MYLAGPPGVGKTTLGRMVAERAGLRFGGLGVEGAELVELSWTEFGDAKVRREARRGALVGLWDHPERLIERVGYRCLPSRKQVSVYGRTGTATQEYRRLSRACSVVIDVQGVELAEAVAMLVEVVEELRNPPETDLLERAGIECWPESWVHSADADEVAATLVAEAMAEYILELEAAGTSPRRVRAIASDLDAAGHLVFTYDAPKPAKCLESFSPHDAPHTGKFARKFSGSDAAERRYDRSLRGFGAFLERRG